MKRISKIFVYLGFAITMTAAIAKTLSNSAPASSTGAPGEVDCTTSGCHVSYILNTGQGLAVLSIENNVTTYIPGKTYMLTAEISYTDLERFGFQFVAINNDGVSNAGTLGVSDALRTQIISGYNVLSDRKYMTYTYEGSIAVSPGKGKWQFNWTAPAKDEGDITFYLATVAADNDGTDLGDYCYTKSMTLKSATSGLRPTANVEADELSFEVFPNPVKNKINMRFFVSKDQRASAELYDINGRHLQQLFAEEHSLGAHDLNLNLAEKFESGIYFIKLNIGQKSIFKKIVLSN